MKSVGVSDQSGVSEARRAATDLAGKAGFTEVETGKLALIATELSTNLVKHGSGGEILVGTYEDNESQGIELLALDKGAGMNNVAACLEDGYSSAGTAGRGLGAVIRQSHFVDIGSWPGLGTAVLARVAPGRPQSGKPPTSPTWGGVSIAKSGEEVCGDAWSVSNTGNARTLLVADGLGHGPEAAEAAVGAVRLFHRYNGHTVANLIDYVHNGLRSTRGAAVSIARFDPATRKITYSGIGKRHRHDHGRGRNPANGVDGGHRRFQCPEDSVLRVSVRARPRDPVLRRTCVQLDGRSVHQPCKPSSLVDRRDPVS
jgi:anti-sigma regulatory factor (Ser/Thr protein kinase)